MKKIILEQLRERSRVPKKEKTWISELTDDQLYDLFLRLRNGESCKAIARIVQDSWGISPGSSAHSIGQGVGKFKRRIAHLLITPTEAGDKCSSPFLGGVTNEGTLSSLEHIVNLHRGRITSMLEEEEKSGIRRPFLNRDLQALAALEKVLMKVRVFDKYYHDPRKQERIVGLEKQIGEKFGAAMDTIGEEGKVKIVKALDKFMQLAKEHAEQLEEGPDGKFRLVETKK